MNKSKKTLNRREFLALTGTVLVGASMPGWLPLAMAAQPKYGGTANVGVFTLPNGADPSRFVGLYAQWAWSFCYDGLIDLVPPNVINSYLSSGKPLEDMPVAVPNLAESWEISKDGLDYTFNLMKGVTFHNGKKFMAEDVDFCLKRVLSPKVASSSASKFQSMKEVKILDDHTIRISLEKPLAPFLSFCNMSLPIIAKDSLPMDKMMRKVPKEGPPLPAGTGPFIPTVWKAGKEINFKKFNNFRISGLPYLDGVNLHRVMESTVRFAALRTGELDWVTSIGPEVVAKMLSGKKQKRLVTLTEENYTVFVTDLLLTGVYSLNMREAPFNDFRVRKAFALAINRDQIAAFATSGLGGAAIQNYTKSTTPFWMDGLSYPEQNMQEAKTLLQEAGFGKGLAVTFLAENTSTWAIKGAQVLQQQMKKIGVDIKIEILQRAGYWPRIRKQDFQITSYGLGNYFVYDPSDMYDSLYSWDKNKNWRNLSGYNNHEMDKLLDMGLEEMSLSKRKEIYKKIYELLIKDIPYIPILSSTANVAWRNNLKGYDPLASVPDLRAFKSVWIDKG